MTDEDHFLVKKSLKKGTKYWFEDCYQLSPNGNFKKVKCNSDEPVTNGYICETGLFHRIIILLIHEIQKTLSMES